MSNIDEKILNKIKKCLALSQSPEPHEAAAALRQAQKLMEAHGVKQMDLVQSDIGEAEVKSKASVSRVKGWELNLLNVVARSFGCKLMWSGSSSYRKDVFGRYVLIGLKTQVELAQYTAEVLQRKLIKGRAQFVQGLSPYLDKKRKTAEADGFCFGWVEAVSKTVQDFATPDEVVQLIDAKIQSYCGDRKAKTQSRSIGHSGYNAGLEAGASESIQRPVSSKSPTIFLTSE